MILTLKVFWLRKLFSTTSQKKRGTKRRRSGVPVVVTRRPRRTRPARVFRRGGGKRPRVLSSASARAFFDASRWHHAPDLGVPDQLSSYTPIKGVTRKAVTAPTGLGASVFQFFLNHISSSMYAA